MIKNLRVLLLCIFILPAVNLPAQVYNWAKSLVPPTASIVYGTGQAVDDAGNIYITGSFNAAFDVDMGPGTFMLLPVSGYDIFICKYDNTGTLLWAKVIGSAGTQFTCSIAIDATGNNFYLGGGLTGTTDFDPGPGITMLSADADPYPDGFICKYSSDGVLVWGHSFLSSDEIFYVKPGENGSVYALASFRHTIDANPGAGVATLIPTVEGVPNAFLIKFDQNGDYLNAVKIAYSPGSGDQVIDMDFRNGYVYTLTNAATTSYIDRYDTNLNLIWTKSSLAFGQGLATDDAGNIVISGLFYDTVDFDLGAGVHNETAPPDPGGTTLFYLFVLKLDNNGNFQWVKTMGADQAFSQPGAGHLILDQQNGDIYLPGLMMNEMHFDGNNPAGIFNCQGNDAFVLRLDASGNFIWAVGATGAGQAGGQTIAIDAQKNIYTVGWVGSGVTDFNPDPIVANTLTGSTSPYTYFVWKLSPLGPVAVKLVNFNVKKESRSVNLYWTTEQEINSKTFIVERSTDQRVWNEITRLNTAGNSTQKINYTATDFNPAKAVNYYRLKQVDLDGKFNYSEIRSVYFGNDVNVVVVPNPAVDKVIVYLPGNTTNVSINIYNMNGQLVKQLSSNEEAVQINVAELSKGIYSIRVNGRNVNEVKRLVVE